MSQWDGSFEHQKHMFKLMGKEINTILGAQMILIWTYMHVVDNWFHICMLQLDRQK